MAGQLRERLCLLEGKMLDAGKKKRAFLILGERESNR
jgi:hypothetical protein